MITRFERFSFAIAEIDRCWHKLAAEEMEKYGLSSAHAVYLNALYQNREGITAAQLSELCGKDKSNVSRMISVMEKKGLVYKEGIGKNLYRALLKLTAEGRAAAEHVQRRAALAVELAGNGISDAHREIFYSALERITENLQTLSKEGLPKQ